MVEPVDDDVFPDIRVVTVSIDAIDGEVGDIEVDASGCGHYEAVGMLLAAVLKLASPSIWQEDDDSETDDSEWTD